MLKKIISKAVDEIASDIGFKKIEDTGTFAQYMRYDERFKYAQIIEIIKKKSGRHICLSYDKDLTDERKIGNTCVGLTSYEMKLFALKMWSMGLRTKKKHQLL